MDTVAARLAARLLGREEETWGEEGGGRREGAERGGASLEGEKDGILKVALEVQSCSALDVM